ncbi:hypothetical protein ACFL0I_00060 [Gemmatimonadota bacterium]
MSDEVKDSAEKYECLDCFEIAWTTPSKGCKVCGSKSLRRYDGFGYPAPMDCPACGLNTSTVSSICHHCGYVLPVERREFTKRYCPSCDEEVTKLSVCPSCGTSLYSESRPRWLASLLGYLYGGLIGGIALLMVYLVEALSSFEPTNGIKMMVFGAVAVGSWITMRDRLLVRKDLAVMRTTQEAGVDPPSDVL